MPNMLGAAVLASMAWVALPATVYSEAPDSLIANDDRVVGMEGGDLVIRIPFLLGNDRALDAELVIDQPPAFGTLDSTERNRLVYQPYAGFKGTVAFTYYLVSGRGVSMNATVTLHVLPRRAPFSADWDGDGKDDLGIYEAYKSRVHLCAIPPPSQGSPASCSTYPLHASQPASWPFAVDRDGDGASELGLFDPQRRRFEFFTFDSERGFRHVEFRTWNRDGDLPLAGDWEGDRKDEIALYRSSEQDLVFDAGTTPPWSDAIDPGRLGELDTFLPFVGSWRDARADTPGFYFVESTLMVFYLNPGKDKPHIVQLEIYQPVVPVAGCWHADYCDVVGFFEDEPPVLELIALGEEGPGRAIAIPIQIGGGDS